MRIGTRLKKLEDKADAGFKVILPAAYRVDGAMIDEYGYRNKEVAYIVYWDEPLLRVDREEDEDIGAFENRAEQIAREANGDAILLSWHVLFL